MNTKLPMRRKTDKPPEGWHAGWVSGYRVAMQAAIAIVRRRHGNDWSANETLRELEKLKELTR